MFRLFDKIHYSLQKCESATVGYLDEVSIIRKLSFQNYDCKGLEWSYKNIFVVGNG